MGTAQTLGSRFKIYGWFRLVHYDSLYQIRAIHVVLSIFSFVPIIA